MSFPDKLIIDLAEFYGEYIARLRDAQESVSRAALSRAAETIAAAIRGDRQIWSCGNGGSAAIANHLVCDHSRGIAKDTGLRPRIHSLSANVEILTAIANDVSYAEVFSGQLALQARPGDVLITISSSGDSENVVNAIAWAKANGLATIALTGFAGGRTRTMADISLHVEADNYGIVEDAHQALMHVLAQSVRMTNMPPDLIAQRRF